MFPHLTHLAHDEAVVGRHADAHAQVYLLVHHVQAGRVLAPVDHQLGIGLQPFQQGEQEGVFIRQIGDGHAHQAGDGLGLLFFARREQALAVFQQLDGLWQELLAEFREIDLAGVALKERLTQPGFQFGDHPADHRRRYGQAAGGFLELQGLGQGAEDFQGFEAVVHGCAGEGLPAGKKRRTLPGCAPGSRRAPMIRAHRSRTRR